MGRIEDGRTHTHQTKRRVSYNTSPLTKPSAELEIKVDVKYVGEDERMGGLKGELARFGGNGKEVKISGNG